MWISILSVVIKAVKKIPLSAWISVGVLCAWIGSTFWAYHEGQAKVQRDWDESVDRGKVLVDQLKKQQVIVTTKVETVYLDRVITIKEKADVIEKQIPILVPDYRSTLSGGFRLLHDAAATSTFPDSTRVSESPPVSVGDVASTVNHNYEQCNIWREQVIGWNTWYDEQLKLYQKPSK